MKALNYQIISLLLLIMGTTDAVYCQEITRQDEILITSVDSAGATSFQVANIIEYDNGALDSTVTERTDSFTFVNQQFVRAHNSKLPIRQAIRTLAMKTELNNVFNGAADLIESVTGETYFDVADTRGFYNDFPGIWRVLVDVEASAASVVDTIEFSAWFKVNANGVGVEIVSLSDPTPVVDGIRIRLSPYQADFIRFRVVQPNQSKNIDVAYLFDIVDETNPNSARSKREFWSNEIRTGPGGVRLIKFPDATN